MHIRVLDDLSIRAQNQPPPKPPTRHAMQDDGALPMHARALACAVVINVLSPRQLQSQTRDLARRDAGPSYGGGPGADALGRCGRWPCVNYTGLIDLIAPRTPPPAHPTRPRTRTRRLPGGCGGGGGGGGWWWWWWWVVVAVVGAWVGGRVGGHTNSLPCCREASPAAAVAVES